MKNRGFNSRNKSHYALQMGLDHREGKRLASSLHLKKGWVLFTVLLIWVAGFSFYQRELLLEITHQETGQVYLSMPVQTGDSLELQWIHSFEHIPWHEFYSIEGDGRLLLEQIAVAGFGAGIPENKGRVTVEAGMVMMKEINESFPDLKWIHSETALPAILLNGTVLLQGKELSHHQPLMLKITRRRYAIWQRIRRRNIKQ